MADAMSAADSDRSSVGWSWFAGPWALQGHGVVLKEALCLEVSAG